MNMRSSHLPAPLQGLLMLAAVLLGSAARAEDIDIYSDISGATDLPNVLIILDNSANWSANINAPNCVYNENGVPTTAGPPAKEQGTKMGIEKCALYNLIDALPTNTDGTARFNIGLMLFNESPASISGGYPLVAIKPLEVPPAPAISRKDFFKQKIRELDIGDDKGNNAAFAKTLHEAYLYLTSSPPNVGKLGTKTIFDAGAFVGDNYALPSINNCARNYVIFITNGSPGENTDNEAKALLASVGGDTRKIDYPNSQITNSDQANWADEYARFMSSTDVSSKDGTQSIIVHTVAVTGASSDGKYPNFIEAIASHGNGRYTQASDPTSLADALQDLFNKIQAASSVFSSASLPISVNSRGTYSNHIFMGMFLPDGDSKPRWIGNLKQYQFTYSEITDVLELADSEGRPAINEGTGFIAPGVESYWTHSSSFWVNAPAGTPVSASDNPDGDIIAKGAAAQRLRDLIMADTSVELFGRDVFTCVSCAEGTDLTLDIETHFTDKNAANITAAALGVTTAEDRTTLIDWVRGMDNKGDEQGPGGTVRVRPSVHGDVLHSRPAVLDYGGTTGIVAFYGANDGMLHAVVGNKEGADAGTTLWSFLPEEHFPKLKRLRDNDPIVRFPSTISDTAIPRDYFVDGPISAYQKFDADGNLESVWVFVSMRRGGRFLYAFDVTDPRKPKYLWRKTSTDIAILGQTWSEPRLARIKGHTGPVIVMGAGYDPIEDFDSPGSPTMGNAVLVLDAESGNVIRTFGSDPDDDAVERPVPADVSLVDSDSDGFIDRAYAVDLGGNIYRIDFELTDPDTGTVSSLESDWRLVKLAELGSSGGKKFFYAPDVVVTNGFAIVLAGSGDREKPLRADTQDYFYTVLDRQTGKGVNDAFQTITFANLANQKDFTSTASGYGCYSALAVGEKVVNAPITIAGRTYFGTNQPQSSANSCDANLGLAKSYAAPLVCKQPIGTELVGGGLPPSPVAGVVALEGPDGEVKHVPFIIGGNPYAVDTNGDGINDGPSACNKAIGGCKVTPLVDPKRSKVYWYPETER